jgi:hypothetical protein
LDRAQNFPEAVFLGVAMEWLLDDEDVWSVELEYRLKRAITFDPTVGSRLKFYRGFPEAVFTGVAMEWLLGDKDV